ncbi:synaptonemal complex protein 3 isoform X2 [Hippocampus zosterae]|uniref:synaptonemal complex protein 3 isoform X2 n=1 Tax=Hippocampus zosterae TaxID=109293 RepID=UPI00223E2F3B|nr:synaptonemal complex protein 3 isoform X2 [Hippocampus zosterae]
MSAGKRLKKKKLSEEALSKVFDFSPVAKKKALNYGSEDDPGEASEEKTPIAPLKKRPICNLKDEDSAVAVGSEVHNMLERFGADINKVMLNKRKRLESLTKTYMNGGQLKMEQLWNDYHKQRQKMTQECSQQLSSVLQQWQLEVQQVEEQEEKLNNLMRQQQKVIQQSKVLQKQKVETLQELFKHFVKNMEDMEKSQEDILHRAQQELRKEMATMQKKILMDTQQQEMASVRKSLQSMLF